MQLFLGLLSSWLFAMSHFIGRVSFLQQQLLLQRYYDYPLAPS
jgi:hypothetical protein